mmetsp:Transcript_42296/g.117773  ORF Transcript_42296/g.117773 Transcript_42296/m.117773 type:complete len:100 (-) Transcript_42296:558-857(-)
MKNLPVVFVLYALAASGASASAFVPRSASVLTQPTAAVALVAKVANAKVVSTTKKDDSSNTYLFGTTTSITAATTARGGDTQAPLSMGQKVVFSHALWP